MAQRQATYGHKMDKIHPLQELDLLHCGEHCSLNYDSYSGHQNPVYTNLVPVNTLGFCFDEVPFNGPEICVRPKCRVGDIEVYQIPASNEVFASLGEYKYPIDPFETFETLQSFQTQKTAPVPATERPVTPSYGSSNRRPHGVPHGHTGSGRNRKLPRAERLWEFILRLLLDPNYNPSHIEWVDRERGMFRLVNSRQIARMWGKRKNNHDMTYEKLSRAMRYYYHRKILQPVFGKKLVYKFGPNSTGWQITEGLTAG